MSEALTIRQIDRLNALQAAFTDLQALAPNLRVVSPSVATQNAYLMLLAALLDEMDKVRSDPNY